MVLKVREQLKILLAQEATTMTNLAKLLTEKTGKTYTAGSISHRSIRGGITYNEMLEICEILGYEIEFKRK